MNKEETFIRLHELVTGVKKGTPDRLNPWKTRNFKSSYIKEFENLNSDEGVFLVEKKLKAAKDYINGNYTDWGYWRALNEIDMCKVLMRIFKAMKSGVTKFPELPTVKEMNSSVMMDKGILFEKWSKKIEQRRKVSKGLKVLGALLIFIIFSCYCVAFYMN